MPIPARFWRELLRFPGQASLSRRAAPRGLQREALEQRTLLAVDGFHNVALPADVDGSGAASPLDALILVQDLATFGPRSLDGPIPIGPSKLDATPDSLAAFPDVNADGAVTAADVQGVVLQLNAKDENDLIEFRIDAVDADDNVLTQVAVGDEFFIRFVAVDLRDGTNAKGVFSAYVDITYNAALLDVTGPIVFSDAYGNGHTGATSTDGLIDDAGAFLTNVFGTPGPDPVEILRVPVIAEAAGTVAFGADGPENVGSDVLVVGDTNTIAEENILFTPGTVTVVSNAPPKVSIADVSIAEGDSGTTTLDVTVQLDAAPSSEVSVLVTTSDLSAVAGEDYTQKSERVAFAAGATTATFSIAIAGDTAPERDERFRLLLTEPQGLEIADNMAVVTITNDDEGTVPTVSIADATVNEDDASGAAVFVISLSEASVLPVTVEYSTVSDTATANVDFTPTIGTAVIPAGETSVEVSVPITNDTLIESDERFRMRLVDSFNATIADNEAIGTIVDDDLAVVSIGDASVLEGDSGTTNLVFPVTLDQASPEAITITYSTADGTATAPDDYTAVSGGTLVIAAGATTGEIVITVNGDEDVEANETLTVSIDSVSSAGEIGDGSATGTITNDDGTPTLSISDAAVTEGDSGTKSLSFTVSLSEASSSPVTFTASTVDGTATAGQDYTALSNAPFTIAAGATTTNVTVSILGDEDFEADETFTLTLASIVGAAPGDVQAVGTITNDDAASLPVISIADQSIAEGNSGTTAMTFTVQLDRAADSDVTFSYRTSAGTATSGVDYTAIASGSGTIAAGSSSTTITVNVLGDTTVEPNETFNVELFNVSGASEGDLVAVGTITNDDGADLPVIRINNASITEGASGTKTLQFTVVLSKAGSEDVTFLYSTSDGTATAGSDYDAKTGQAATIPAGQTSTSINITIRGDQVVESDETFTVTLSSITGATAGDVIAQGTILNDDSAEGLTVSILDAVPVAEQDGLDLVFVVELSQATDQDVFVDFVVRDVTAEAGVDFVNAGGTLHVNANNPTQGEIKIRVIGDNLVEPDETFEVILRNPASHPTVAQISDGVAVGTILADASDSAPTIYVEDVSTAEGNGDGTKVVSIPITLSSPLGQDLVLSYTFETVPASDLPAGVDPATGGVDFQIPTSPRTVTIPAGSTQATVSVNTRSDNTYERDEAFRLVLLPPDGGTFPAGFGRTFALATLVNDDPAPTLSVGDVILNERSSDVDGFVTVTKTGATSLPVTFRVVTQETGSAVAGEDFEPLDGTQVFTIAASATSIQVPVKILADSLSESSESFSVRITDVVNGVADDAEGIVTIQDLGLADSVLSRAIVRAVDSAGNPLSQVADGDEFFLEVSVEDVRGVPYGIVAGFFDIAYNASLVQVNGAVQHDPLFDSNTRADTSQSGLIVATGGMTDTVGDTNQGAGGGEQLLFRVPMKAIGSGTATFDLRDSSDQANASTLLSPVTSGGNPSIMRESLGAIQLTDATLAVGGEQATFNVTGATVTEGSAGARTPLVFTLTLSQPVDHDITVNYSFGGGTATAGVDYEATSGSVIFTAGSTSRTVSVDVLDDSIREGQETFTMTVTSTDPLVGTAQAVGTILDNEAAPTLSIADVTMAEGNSGTKTFNFVVTLSGASQSNVTVDYATAPDTASAGTDYTSTSGTLTFGGGTTQRTISVIVHGDTFTEIDERFFVNLTNPTGATIADAQAVGTITNDDVGSDAPSTFQGYVYHDANGNGTRDASEKGLAGIELVLNGTTVAGGSISRQTTTDANGSYTFDSLPAGKYTVVEAQHGAFVDGAEQNGSGALVDGASPNDTFIFDINGGVAATDFNFGERGLKPQFITKQWVSTTTTSEVKDAIIADLTTRYVSSINGSQANLMAALEERSAAAETTAPTGDVQSTLSGGVLTVFGTDGDDDFRFVAGDSLVVTVNGASKSYSRSEVHAIVFDGGAGRDAATLTGDDGDDVAELFSEGAVLAGAGYRVTTTSTSNVIVYGGGGDDLATLHESAFDDALEAMGDRAAISAVGVYAHAVSGFEKVIAVGDETTGDHDESQIDAVDFVLELNGDWN